MSMVKVMMIIASENCNLDCSYCYEHHKSDSYMEFDTVKKIIDHNFEMASKEEVYEIEFFGGEPFLNFPLIKQVVQYIQTNYSEYKVYFSASTNGTLVHGEIEDWLKEHRDVFTASLSLDGTKEMHDTNRPFKETKKGSFDYINLDFFLSNYKEPHAKMTISPETLPNMAEGIKYIHGLGFECDATLASGIDWKDHYNIQVLSSQLDELIKFYKDNPEINVCRMLKYDLASILNPNSEKFRYCGAGKTLRAFDCNGNMYPCQGFAPVTLGEEAKAYIGEDFEGFVFDENSVCGQCRFINICPTCYACNKAATGEISLVDSDMCFLNRMCILAAAKIEYYRKIGNGDNSRETQATLKAINVIQQEIFSPQIKYLNNMAIVC